MVHETPGEGCSREDGEECMGWNVFWMYTQQVSFMTLRVQGEGLREREESRVPPGILWGVITGRCFEMRVTGVKGKKSCFLYTPLSSYPAYRPSGTRRVGVFPTPGNSAVLCGHHLSVLQGDSVPDTVYLDTASDPTA